MYRTFVLEYLAHFLGEQRSKLYKWYCLGVAQSKNAPDAKSLLQSWALPNLERGGA